MAVLDPLRDRVVLLLGAMLTYLVSTGIGVWGNNRPIGWAWDITNFVFWIGIGHAGTLISAILLLLKQDWRTSINRFSEAMTLFAVAQQSQIAERCVGARQHIQIQIKLLNPRTGQFDGLAIPPLRCVQGSSQILNLRE